MTKRLLTRLLIGSVSGLVIFLVSSAIGSKEPACSVALGFGYVVGANLHTEPPS